ncbi:rCG56192 [Rattus norvegicus]|uniref:RCG56192 n=1 Tax=Rattus norvegicus TaxID=10116 RepID=A6IBN1_RAT|nr:rCG56192 [Rattus norvegicus]
MLRSLVSPILCAPWPSGTVWLYHVVLLHCSCLTKGLRATIHLHTCEVQEMFFSLYIAYFRCLL